MKKLLIALLLLSAVGIVAWLISTAGGDTEIGDLEERSLRLKWTYSSGFAGAIVAKEKGYFREEGIELAINVGGPGLDPVQLVAGGSDDFGITGADRLLQARAQGLPLVAIALENRESFAAFVALEDSGIEEPQDFPGHKIGVFHDDTYTVYQALIRRLNLPAAEIEEIPIGYNLAPLLEGTVDIYSAYVINQPPKLRARGIPHVVIRPKDYGVDFAGNVYFTREELIDQDPETVQGFVNGLVRGWTFVMKEPEEALSTVLAHEPSLNREEEAALLEALLLEFQRQDRPFLTIEEEDLRGTLEIMLDQELLGERVDLDAAVAPGFALQAHRELDVE